MNTRPPYLPPEKSVCGTRSNETLDMEQRTGSKLGKEYIKAVYCHPAYLSCMQNSVQFSCSVPLTLCDPMDSSMPGSSVLPEFAQIISIIYTALTYSFPNFEPVHCSMSSSNCCFLTCIQISQEAGHTI